MLYDKRWDKPEVKADPFSLESLIAWLEKQPAAKEYCFTDFGNCLIAQWVDSIDPQSAHVSGYRYWVNGADVDFDDTPTKWVALGHPRNFGAALTRAREALAQRAR